MLKKALIYLGLGPDEEYEQYDDFAPGQGVGGAVEDERPVVRAVSEPPPAPARPASSTVRPIPVGGTPGPATSAVRAVPADSSGPAVTRPSPGSPGAAPVPAPGVTAGGPRADGASAIRIVESAPAKPHAVNPTSFNDAQGIGDRFKLGQPVIMNLEGAERDLRRRLVDFASGLCYGLGGKMDRVTNQVYLLVPADVEVSSDDARRALD